MKGPSKLSYKEIKASALKQKSQQLSNNKVNNHKSPLFKCCYQFVKFFIILHIILAITIVLLITLGSNQNNIEKNIFQLFKKDLEIINNKNKLQILLQQQIESSFKQVINIHLPKTNQNDKFQQNSITDLKIISEFALNELSSTQKISILPLNKKCIEWCGFISEQITSKGLKGFKQLLKKVLNNLNLKQSSKKKIAQGQSFFSNLKQLIVKKKYSKIKQLIINQMWSFVNSQQNYILYWNNESRQMQNNKQALKSLKKWIKAHDQSTIFIVSQIPINEALETDDFKSYQLVPSFKNVELKNLQSYISFWDQQQCAIIKQKFNSFYQFDNFLTFAKNKQNQVSRILSDQESEIVAKVCQQDHHQFYFYTEQKQAYQIMKKSQIQSEQRWQRQLQALYIKLSHLKSLLGLNYIQDLYKTFTSNSEINLANLNQKGLQYDFKNHEFVWKNRFNKFLYQLQSKNFCGQNQTQIPQKKVQVKIKNQDEENQEQTTLQVQIDKQIIQQKDFQDEAENKQQFQKEVKQLQPSNQTNENIEVQQIKAQKDSEQQVIQPTPQVKEDQEQQLLLENNQEIVEETTQRSGQLQSEGQSEGAADIMASQNKNTLIQQNQQGEKSDQEKQNQSQKDDVVQKNTQPLDTQIQQPQKDNIHS